jgi:hypothetical protein
MRNWLIAAALVVSTSAFGQLTIMGVEKQGGAAVFQGPGDIVTPAASWKMWGGMRAFSAAKRGNRAINVCNPTPVCADVNTDAVTGELPATISISGSDCSSVTCTIQTIYDQTGNLQCAGSTVCDFTQATSNLRPVLLHSCLPNGKWCMNFTGAQPAQAIVSATLGSNPQPFVISNIIFTTGNGTNQQYTPDTLSSTQIRHTTAANGIEVYDGSGPFGATMSDNNWHAYQNTWSGPSSFSIYIDGTPTPLANTGTGGAQMISLGGGYSLPCICKMTEVGIFNGSMSGPTLSNINSNQHTWGGF